LVGVGGPFDPARLAGDRQGGIMKHEKAEPHEREDLDGGGETRDLRPEVLFREDLDCDIISIDEHTWAIHGNIPIDGEVIIAEFDRLEQAEEVLDSLKPAQPPTQPSP
jgi:hypothetical protein